MIISPPLLVAFCAFSVLATASASSVAVDRLGPERAAKVAMALLGLAVFVGIVLHGVFYV